jgi:hypothetical protein
MNKKDKKAIASLIRHKDKLKTPADFDIVIENKKLKDSLSTIRKSFKISDNKSNSNTTTNKQSSNDEKK